MKRIAATDLIRNIGTFLRHAAEGPVTVTSHGRDNSVLISATAYRQLVSRQIPATAAPTVGISADLHPNATRLQASRKNPKQKIAAIAPIVFNVGAIV
jgi:prevent-host-death family protein